MQLQCKNTATHQRYQILKRPERVQDAVLKELKRVAMAENPANEVYFHHRYVPTRDKMEDRNSYFENVGKFAKKWTTTAKNGWYDDYKSKNNIPDSGEEYNKYDRKRNNQGMNVSALGSFLEDVKRKSR